MSRAGYPAVHCPFITKFLALKEIENKWKMGFMISKKKLLEANQKIGWKYTENELKLDCLEDTEHKEATERIQEDDEN